MLFQARLRDDSGISIDDIDANCGGTEGGAGDAVNVALGTEEEERGSLEDDDDML